MADHVPLTSGHVGEITSILLYSQFEEPVKHSNNLVMEIVTARIRRMGKVIFSLCVSVHTSTEGGIPDPAMDGGGGVPRSQIFGGSQVSDFLGGRGPRSQIFRGGQSQVSDFQGGYPVSVKGKNFDTRFGLIHVQTGKKFFVEGPPPSKGKNF